MRSSAPCLMKEAGIAVLTEKDYDLLLARLSKLDTTPLEREYRGERLTVCVREVGKPWPVIAVLRMVYERPGMTVMQNCESVDALKNAIKILE